MEDKNAIKTGRLNSILQTVISQFIAEHANKNSFITVSFLDLNRTKNFVRVYCTVFPEDQETSAMAFLSRKERDCKEYIKKHTSLRTIPTVRFFLSPQRNVVAPAPTA